MFKKFFNRIRYYIKCNEKPDIVSHQPDGMFKYMASQLRKPQLESSAL
jgi:hypothetical protein